MPENICFGKPNQMTHEEIAQTFKTESGLGTTARQVIVCKNSGFYTPMKTLFPNIAPPGYDSDKAWYGSALAKQQRYAKAVRALAKLHGDFSALQQGARARVFANPTGELPNTIFFERSGIAGAASVGAEGTLTVFKLFNHIDIKSPKLVKELMTAARYVRRFAA